MWWRRRRRTGDPRHAVRALAAAEGMTLTPTQERAVDRIAEASAAYLVGPPGSGKTVLLDWFVRAWEDEGAVVVRTHLHAFFADLHRRIDRCGGFDAGLAATLRRGGRACDVLCLDEFTVHDPADGVFCDRMLRAVARSGTRIVVTSNRRPDRLMPDPRFHAAFAPTAASIAAMFDLIEVDDGVDLRTCAPRRDAGFGAGVWTVGAWPGGAGRPRTVRPGTQAIAVLELPDRAAAIDFAELCARPLNAADYLWLTDAYRAITVTSVPAEPALAAAARWAVLLDVLHDADVRLDVWAHASRSTVAARLVAVLPDADRAVSRMGAWVECGAPVSPRER